MRHVLLTVLLALSLALASTLPARVAAAQSSGGDQPVVLDRGVGLLSMSIERLRDDSGRVRAIRITIRVWDVRTEQVRQITIVQDL